MNYFCAHKFVIEYLDLLIKGSEVAQNYSAYLPVQAAGQIRPPLNEDFMLLNADMSSAFSVVSSVDESAEHPKRTDLSYTTVFWDREPPLSIRHVEVLDITQSATQCRHVFNFEWIWF